MSGKPNPEGVKTLREWLRDYADTRNTVAILKNNLAADTALLEKKQEHLGRLSADIGQILERMDVRATGNMGYEARRFELLLLLSQE